MWRPPNLLMLRREDRRLRESLIRSGRTPQKVFLMSASR